MRVGWVIFVLLKIVFWFGRLEANAGALTNYEVVDFLRSKGAANDSTRVLAQVSPSEYKVLFSFYVDSDSPHYIFSLKVGTLLTFLCGCYI